jgi:UPF0042 nucleotide-binding protein
VRIKKVDLKANNRARKIKNISRVVIITGLSGSGKTVALRSLEDSGFFCVDNLPVSLISFLIAELTRDKKILNIAIGIDIREKEFLADFDKVINTLKSKLRIEIHFFEAETDVLIRRFKETRRPHPLGGNLDEAIRAERKSLLSLREKADKIIETSSFTPHQLRRFVSSLSFPKGNSEDMIITITSFGYKYGVPQNIDLLFDVRFLPNPHFVPALRHLRGTDDRVSKYIFKHRETKEFIKKIKDLLYFLIPFFIREGRSYLAIAVGCTGGNHRSPAIVEEIGRSIRGKNVDLKLIHRDIS